MEREGWQRIGPFAWRIAPSGDMRVQRHEPAVEVKGATYTDLRVQPDANGIWSTQCIIDV